MNREALLLFILVKIILIVSCFSTNSSNPIVLQPIYVDENGNERSLSNNNDSNNNNNNNRNNERNSSNNNQRCVAKGKYKQFCMSYDAKLSNYQRNRKYKQYYTCYKKARCELKNGKCQWLKTRKFNKCIKKYKKQRDYRDNYYDSYYRDYLNRFFNFY